MAETFQFYVKATSNCEALPLQTFERLSPEWTGESLVIPFGPESDRLALVGWTDLFGGSPCPVHVVKARHGEFVGYLVHGGNSGVRILDEHEEPTPGVDEHLPPGWGTPLVWVALDDVGDLPDEVRAVVTPEEED